MPQFSTRSLSQPKAAPVAAAGAAEIRTDLRSRTGSDKVCRLVRQRRQYQASPSAAIAGQTGAEAIFILRRRDWAIGLARRIVGSCLFSLLFCSQTMFAQVTLVPVITTVSGNGTHGYSGDNGVATSAVLNYPWGIAVDASGNLYFSDYESNRIRKVSSNGIITTVAGNGIGEYSGDNGLAISAGLRYPAGLAVDASGALYIADSGNYAVRKVTTDGNITTVAGTGTGGYSGDNGIARSARLSSPEGLALDASGNLYIADTFNHRIRKVSLGGIITTVAGTGTAGFFGDGGSAISAELNTPRGIVVDASGNLYIADSLNHRIRMVSTSGIISTVAGTGTAGYLGDGGPANSAELNTPYGIALDASGDLYIADFWNDLIRKVGTRSLTA